MTMNTTMNRGWIAAAVAAILVTIVALSFLGSARAQSVADLVVGTVTVAPNETVTVSVTGTTDGLGSYRVDVAYDSTLIEATECTSDYGVCSINEVADDTVRINGTDLAGITGDDVVLGTITFLAGPDEGVVPLAVVASTLVLSDTAGEVLTVVASEGSITVAAAAEATATAAAVPASGGPPGSSSANSMAWLLAAGLVVMFAGGGAWVMARAGRRN